MSDHLDTWPDDGPVYIRKLPVTVEAYRFNGSNGPQVVEWAGVDDEGEPLATWSRFDGLVIRTLEGDHIATVGDWVIRGVEDEVYPVKPSIFHATYERVGD